MTINSVVESNELFKKKSFDLHLRCLCRCLETFLKFKFSYGYDRYWEDKTIRVTVTLPPIKVPYVQISDKVTFPTTHISTENKHQNNNTFADTNSGLQPNQTLQIANSVCKCTGACAIHSFEAIQEIIKDVTLIRSTNFLPMYYAKIIEENQNGNEYRKSVKMRLMFLE